MAVSSSFANIYLNNSAAECLGEYPDTHGFSADGVDLNISEAILEKFPSNIEALTVVAEEYTLIKKYEEGLKADLKLVELRPDDHFVAYNLGCSYALTNQADKSIETLRHAINLGYEDIEMLEEDDDLVSLHNHNEFIQLIDELKERRKLDTPSK